MVIPFKCLKCSKLLQAPDDARAKPIRCPFCQTAMRVPAKTRTPPLAIVVASSTTAPAAIPSVTNVHSPPSRKLPQLIRLGIAATIFLACSALGITGAWRLTRSAPATEQEQTEAQQKLPQKEDPKQHADNFKLPLPAPMPPLAVRDGDELDPLPPLPVELAPADVPLFIGQIHSLNKLLHDGRLFAASLGYDKDLEAGLKQFQKTISPDGMQGLDFEKPWGCYARVGNAETEWAVVLLLPMGGEKSFRRLLGDLGLEQQKPVGDLVPYKLPQSPLLPAIFPVRIQLPEQVYVRFTEDYAHICLAGNPNLLTGDHLVAAASMFVRRDKLLSLTLRLDRLPEAWRQTVVMKLKDFKNRIPRDDNAIVQAHKEKAAELFVGYLIDFMTETRNLSFDLGVNPGPESLAADLYLQAVSGSRLADHLTAMSATPSVFGSWPLLDSAFGIRVNVRLPHELRLAVPAIAEEATRQTLLDIKEPQEREKYQRLFRVLGDIIAAGELDGTAVYRTQGEGKPGSLVGGIKVPNGLALEKLARQAIDEMQDKEIRELIELDALKIGDVSFHRFNVQQQFLIDLQKAFGANPFYYAFRPNAVLWAAGVGVKEALPEALQAQPRLSPLLQVALDLHRLTQVIPLQAKDAKLAKEAFNARRSGRVRLELSGGNALRLHVGLDLAVLRFLSIRLAQVQSDVGIVR